MNRKRYELSFDAHDDADYIALIETYRAQGHAVIDVIRMAIRAFVNGPSEPLVDDLETSPLIDELRGQIAAMQTEIDALNAILAERLAGIEMELSRLRAGDLAMEDHFVFDDPQEARQQALSHKLKTMQFNELKH